MFYVYIENEFGAEELTFTTANEKLALEIAAQRGGWVEAQ